MSDANERLNEILVKSIERLDGAVDKGVDFAVEQAPDLIQQLLMWHTVRSALVSVICVSVLVAICINIRRVWMSDADDDERFGWGLSSLMVSTVPAVSVFHNTEWLMILIAPKLYLFEYAAELVK